MASDPTLAYNLIPAQEALGMISTWDLLSAEERSAEIDASGAPITEGQVDALVKMIKRHVLLGVYPYVTHYILPHDGTEPCYDLGGLLVIGSKL